MTSNPPPPESRYTTLPLWRLLVALADAERINGPASPTSHELAKAVREKLRQESGPVREAARG